LRRKGATYFFLLHISIGEKHALVFIDQTSGADPTTFKFTTTTTALQKARAFFVANENIFDFKTH
jgi:hypothetical protein